MRLPPELNATIFREILVEQPLIRVQVDYYRPISPLRAYDQSDDGSDKLGYSSDKPYYPSESCTPLTVPKTFYAEAIPLYFTENSFKI